MMGLETIRAMSNEAAYRAMEMGDDQPMVLSWPGDAEKIRQAPNLGYLQPDGWQLVRVLFCDATGMGSPSEPALTLHQLEDEVVAGRAYSIMEVGQFQIHLAEWMREGDDVPEMDFTRPGVFPPESMATDMAAARAYAKDREASEEHWAVALEPLRYTVQDEARSYIDNEYGIHEMVGSVEEAVRLLKDWDLYDDESLDEEAT